MKTKDLSYGGHNFILDNRLIEVLYLSSVLTVETKKVQQLIKKKKPSNDQVKKYTLLGMEADKCVKHEIFFYSCGSFCLSG